jgi:polyvinyl alcohol dehydrogenase (cytochrome)
VPDEVDGAGVFAVPAIDEEREILYVGTQNAYTEHDAPFGYPISILALDAKTGAEIWAFLAPPNDGITSPTEDVGFSASPNLFTATIDGIERDLVGEGQKSGMFYAVDRDTGEEVWNATISPGGFLGGMEGTSAASNGMIAVPATNWPEFEGPASGLVSGLNWETGEILWTADQSAPAASPAAISNDLVFHAGFDGVLHAYVLADGTEVWTSNLGASVSGGVALANGVVVVGAATPQFAEFIVPGTLIHGFVLADGTATPVGSPDAVPVVSPAT